MYLAFFQCSLYILIKSKRIFGGTENFGLSIKLMVFSKILLGKKMLGPKISDLKNFGSKKFWGKKILEWKIFGSKIIRVQNKCKSKFGIKLVLAEIFHYTETGTNVAATNVVWQMSPKQLLTSTVGLNPNQPSKFGWVRVKTSVDPRNI